MCIWYRGWQFEVCQCIIWDKSWSCGFRCRVPRRKLLRQFLGLCPNCSTMNSDPNIEPSNNTSAESHKSKATISDSAYYPDNVPCDAQYDPSDVFDEALEEHMRHHPWNIMISNSCAAAATSGRNEESGAWGPSSWGPSLNYDTLLKRYTEKRKQWPQQQSLNEQSKAGNQEAKGQQGQKPRPPKETGGNLGGDAQSQPQTEPYPLFIHPKPTNSGRDAQSQPQPKPHPPFIHPRPVSSAAWDGGYESDGDPVPPEYRYKRGI